VFYVLLFYRNVWFYYVYEKLICGDEASSHMEILQMNVIWCTRGSQASSQDYINGKSPMQRE